jgi:hypothetical protein
MRFQSHYPPGVTGNEPEISGEAPDRERPMSNEWALAGILLAMALLLSVFVWFSRRYPPTGSDR